MVIEKRNLDGSKIKGNSQPSQTIDWDTDLGGPVVKVPKEAPREAPEMATNPKKPAKSDADREANHAV